MKRTALLIGLFIITGMLLSGQRTSRDLEGAWSGKLKTPSVELQIVFRFTITEADSIKAVLEPADTEYLYFLHKGDGTHAFAKTLEEHLANEARYPDRQ